MREGRPMDVNPERHPEPTLPPREYLEGEYLMATTMCNPYLLREVRKLVSYAGRERR